MRLEYNFYLSSKIPYYEVHSCLLWCTLQYTLGYLRIVPVFYINACCPSYFLVGEVLEPAKKCGLTTSSFADEEEFQCSVLHRPV